MASPLLLRFFSLTQTIVFRTIGNKIPTKAAKPVTDIGFIIFEKMGVKFPAIADVYLKFYENVVRDETKLANITPSDRVLVIGSGSLPATPILINKLSGASIVTIDRDHKAVKKCTDYLHRNHLDTHITVAEGEGLTYPANDFTVIFLMYGVKNTQAVLDSLPRRTQNACRVVIRLMSDLNHQNVDNLDLTTHFIVKNQVHTTTLGSFDTFLLEKKQA